MKTVLLVTLLIITLLTPHLNAQTTTPTAEDFLYAIREVETGNCYDAPTGSCGEEGAYQFKKSVWSQHTHVSFSEVHTHYSDQVALAHYHWIIKRLKNAHITPSITKIASAWNCGVTAVIRGKIPHSTKDYAERVNNLALDHAQNRLQETYALSR
jgi:hypothetical protein